MSEAQLVVAAIIAVIVGAVFLGIHAIGAAEDAAAAKKAAEEADAVELAKREGIA